MSTTKSLCEESLSDSWEKLSQADTNPVSYFVGSDFSILLDAQKEGSASSLSSKNTFVEDVSEEEHSRSPSPTADSLPGLNVLSTQSGIARREQGSTDWIWDWSSLPNIHPPKEWKLQHPTNQPLSPPSSPSANQPSSSSANQPSSSSANQPLNPPANQPSNPPVNQPANQPVNKPANQRVDPPANQNLDVERPRSLSRFTNDIISFILLSNILACVVGFGIGCGMYFCTRRAAGSGVLMTTLK